jgi:predicted phage terminase large subunit-like protein
MKREGFIARQNNPTPNPKENVMTTPAAKVFRTSFQAFVKKVFLMSQGKPLGNDLYLCLMVHVLERFLRGDTKELLVNLPGRHLKTLLCSVFFPAFALGLDPSRKFLIVAHSEDLAEDIVRQIREIITSSWYQKTFETRISDGHSRKDDFAVKGGGRVRAAPVRSVTGKGGDVIIFDDPHNVHDWDDDRKKKKVIEAFEILVSRRDHGAMSQMLVVGHRVAEDDLSAHILDNHHFERVCLPLFAPEALKFDLGQSTLELAEGESLRPDAFPPEQIASLRRNHRGSPFWLYYQQGLGPRYDDVGLNELHFPFLGTVYGRQLPEDATFVLSIDPAQKTKSTSRNVIHVYAIRQDQRIELHEAFAEKCSFRDLLRKILRLRKRYQAACLVIENTARGPDIIDELRGKISAQIIAVNPRGTKEDRFRKVVPLIREKRIDIRPSPAVERAVSQILIYPDCAYDDDVDTLTNFLSEIENIRPSRPAGRRNLVAYHSRAVNYSKLPANIFARGPRLLGSVRRPADQVAAGGAEAGQDDKDSLPVIAFDGKKIVKLDDE